MAKEKPLYQLLNEDAREEELAQYNSAFARGIDVDDVEEELFSLFKKKNTTKRTIYNALRNILEEYNIPGFIEIEDMNLVTKDDLHNYAVILINNLRAFKLKKDKTLVENFTRAAKNLSKVIEELRDIHTAVERAAKTNAITKPAKIKLAKSVAVDVLEKSRQGEYLSLTTAASTALINAKLLQLALAVENRIEQLEEKMEEYVETIHNAATGANEAVCDYYGCQCGSDDEDDYEDDDDEECCGCCGSDCDDDDEDEEEEDETEEPEAFEISEELQHLMEHEPAARQAVDLMTSALVKVWAKNPGQVTVDLKNFDIEVKTTQDGFTLKLTRKSK